MPCSNPREIRDRSEEWATYFHKRRGQEILDMIDDRLIDEHENNSDQSNGLHSKILHTVMIYFMNRPIIGKEFVYAAEPERKYVLGRITERGVPAQISNGPVYDDEGKALHAVFLARVARIRAEIFGDNK